MALVGTVSPVGERKVWEIYSGNSELRTTGETIPTKVIHRQPHNSNLLEEREVDIQLDTPSRHYTPQDETPVPPEGHYISV